MTHDPNAPKIRFSLQRGAAAGKFATRRPPGQSEAGTTAMTSDPSWKSSAKRIISKSEPTADSSTTVVAAKSHQALHQPLIKPSMTEQRAQRIADSSEPVSPLDPHRIDLSSDSVFTSIVNQKELRITASAAKSLSKLMSALTIEPGSGKEVPLSIRTHILDTLIQNAHVIANQLAEHVAGPGEPVPMYLRAKLLQQACEFLSDQWSEHGQIDADGLISIAEYAFRGRSETINQDIIDLFHEAGEYTPATTQQISDARITEAVIRSSWALLREVQSFDLNTYDPQARTGDAARPFSYGHDPIRVAKDLTGIVLRIVKENELDIPSIDINTNWKQNSLDRACTLVRAEYKTLTDRALRSSYADAPLEEASLNAVTHLYDNILERIGQRARNSFILIEKNAIDVMSANAFVHYLPRRNKEKTEKTSVHQAQTGVALAESASTNQIPIQDSEPELLKNPDDIPAAHQSRVKFKFGA